jgi:hypothetical protein
MAGVAAEPALVKSASVFASSSLTAQAGRLMILTLACSVVALALSAVGHGLYSLVA